MTVVLTEAAYSDLLEIGRAIAKDSPGRALSFVDELHERCKALSVMARAFPLLPGWEDRGVRRRVFGDYLIFYRVSARACRCCGYCMARATTNAFSFLTNEGELLGRGRFAQAASRSRLRCIAAIPASIACAIAPPMSSGRKSAVQTTEVSPSASSVTSSAPL
jgi:toxin ParE1/3/4